MNRISKQLLKIAREIKALDEEGDGSGFQVFHDMDNYDIKTNYAAEEGEYKNFTGNIRWNGTQGTVKNATFLLSNKHQIVFKNGTWEKGIWKNGTWQNGTWKNGIWEYGWWCNGTWQNGTWKNGIWGYGIASHYKSSVWENGIWENGTWQRGQWQNGTWKNGTWKNGQWLGGTWQNGTFINGYDKNDDYHEGRHGENPSNWYERQF